MPTYFDHVQIGLLTGHGSFSVKKTIYFNVSSAYELLHTTYLVYIVCIVFNTPILKKIEE